MLNIFHILNNISDVNNFSLYIVDKHISIVIGFHIDIGIYLHLKYCMV